MTGIRITTIFAATIAMIASFATATIVADSVAKAETTAATSNGPATYTPAAFKQAQADSKHIIIEVFKKGCGTCAAQQPSLKEARSQYPDAAFFKFDFVNDKSAVEQFKVVKQSTIIVFKGKDEVARIVGETQKDAILGAVAKGA
ncbi:MAG: thioredoxin family protein [Hyphomicrobiaceae bacterium]